MCRRVFFPARAASYPEAARWRKAAQDTLRRNGLDPAPARLGLEIDSRALYSDGGIKLGFGSSAAVAVAVAGLLLAEQRSPAAADAGLRLAGELHRALQGPQGSGVDVAASFYGGVLAVQEGRVEPLNWPPGLCCGVVFTGRSADTATAIARFHEAANASNAAPLNNLCVAARLVRDAWGEDAGAALAALEEYALAWRTLDDSARLGVFSLEHQRLHELARAAGCVYKPSGAGGGDCGLAFSTDPEKPQAFLDSARAAGFLPLELELGVKGLSVAPQSDQA